MKPVRRKIRKHFGLTAHEVAVRSKRPWYFEWLLWVLCLIFGYAIGYFQFSPKKDAIDAVIMENQSLDIQRIKLERQLQIEHATQKSFQDQLKALQDENLKLKEDLLFYQQMSGKAKK